MTADETTRTRTWIVSLQSRSAVRIADNKLINILASPQSTVSVAAVRVRNQMCLSDADLAGPTFFGGLVAEASGQFADMNGAVDLLANLASPHFQAVALAANAAIDEPQDIFAFAPPAANLEGEFIVQRASHMRAPAVKVRDLPAPLLCEVLDGLNKHPREDRIHRAMAHYRMALLQLAPQNWVLAAESLYVAVENLATVTAERLRRDAGLDEAEDWKHQLALARGLQPRDNKDRSHLGRFDSWVREHEIFSGDRECYRQLLNASDAWEHGFAGFDRVRELATASAADAFGYVRRAILREVGIAAESELFDAKYDFPLGDWHPVLELEGTYTDSALKLGPGFTPDRLREEWPEFLGPSLIPRIGRIVDSDGTRTVDLVIDGNGHSLRETEHVTLGRHRWIAPSGQPEPHEGDPGVTRVVLNGEDITDQVRREPTQEE